MDSDAGASGPDSGSITLSRGGIIALIVVAVSICVFGGKFHHLIQCDVILMNRKLYRQCFSTWRRRGRGRSERLSEGPQEG